MNNPTPREIGIQTLEIALEELEDLAMRLEMAVDDGHLDYATQSSVQHYLTQIEELISCDNGEGGLKATLKKMKGE